MIQSELTESSKYISDSVANEFKTNFAVKIKRIFILLAVRYVKNVWFLN